MGGVVEIFAGAAVGALFSVLYDVVKDVKDKTIMFRELLGDLDSTLEALNPLIKDIERYKKVLDQSNKEVLKIVRQIADGEGLVLKCSKLSRWKSFKKYKYAKQLLDLDKCLNRLLKILNVEGIRNGFENLHISRENLAVSKEALAAVQKNALVGNKENVVIQKQDGFHDLGSVPESPRVTVGLDEPLRDLKIMLLKDDVSMLVLTAAGGCGKTTLAMKFCQDEDVKDKFKENIFFVTVSKEPNLDVVQELYQRMKSQETGRNPLLLVLDDVWLKSKSLLQKFDELELPNYKILVTSRSEFPGFGTPYNLKALNDEDSMTLLRHSASLGDSLSVPEDLLRKILKHCKGVPLAITVTGKSLRGQATEFWRSRLTEWSKSSILDSETELLLRLQSSIDDLEEKEAVIKECFMDLGSFPEDQRIPAAAFIDMWIELYKLDDDFLCIKNLLELTTRGLANLVITRKENIEIVDDYYIEHFVSQHDMLRQLAIYNAKLDPIEDRKRLIVVSGHNQPKWLTEQKSQPINARLLSISSVFLILVLGFGVKSRGMSGGADGLFGGDGLGTVFNMLYDVLKELTAENILDLPDVELENLKQHLEEGIKLLQKCGKIRWWSVYKRYKYANKLTGWDESLQRLLEVLKVQEIRDVKDNSVSVKNVEKLVSRIESNLVIPKKPDSEAWCAVPELPPLVVGLDFPLNELKRKLLKDENVSMVVLTAPGGCGKTTLATKFCQDKDGKDTFMDNIFFVTVSKKPNLENIVQDLYQRKGFEVPTFQNEVSTVTWLQSFLKEEGQSPLLIVLDDVWSGSESLVEKFDHFKTENCKFLVTSRSEFQGYGSPYYLQLLDHDNAMKLFHHSASLGDKSSHVAKDIREKIVERCKGFPLAITVVGRSLCGEPIEIWQKRVLEWSKGFSILDSETELLFFLERSLDTLGKEMVSIRECFLDLGSFPEDQRIPAAALIHIWAELYDLDTDTKCIANLYVLTKRSLANLVITSCYFADEGFSTKWHNMQMPEAEVLVLNFQTKNYALPDSAVNMDELKAVIVTNYGFLPAELSFNNCYISISSAFPKLEEMNIDYCSDLIELPAELCDLSKLKKLSVTNCHKLNCQSFQPLKNLGKVDFLNISDCFSIKMLPEDIGEMHSLRKINMGQCSRLQELPPLVVDLKQLEEVVCDEETKYLWESLSFLNNVRIIVVKENINLNWLHKTQF
ncbi:unnamed protein product [Malus baccata var. baccata]